MAGIFVTRGMKIEIPVGEFVLPLDGQSTPSITFHVRFDVCPTWLEIAARHVEEANERRIARIAAWNSSDEDLKAETLEREFECSMQAMMAAAIAVDSLYANLRDNVSVSKEDIAKWKESGTARYKQISEVVRRAFPLNNRNAVNLRKCVKEIFKARDLAVHPSGNVRTPVLHPELQVGVEWRFAYFRAENAGIIVRLAKQIVSELTIKGAPANAEVERYAKSLVERLTLSQDGPEIL